MAIDPMGRVAETGTYVDAELRVRRRMASITSPGSSSSTSSASAKPIRAGDEDFGMADLLTVAGVGPEARAA